jgi:hypothetical protein
MLTIAEEAHVVIFDRINRFYPIAHFLIFSEGSRRVARFKRRRSEMSLFLVDVMVGRDYASFYVSAQNYEQSFEEGDHICPDPVPSMRD